MNIGEDPWIPGSPDRKVISARGQTVLTTVSDLIDPIAGSLDEALVHSIFNPVDVRRILEIPVHHSAFEDFIAWHPDRKGLFTVRSAYKIQWQRSFQGYTNRIGGPTSSQTPEIWILL